ERPRTAAVRSGRLRASIHRPDPSPLAEPPDDVAVGESTGVLRRRPLQGRRADRELRAGRHAWSGVPRVPRLARGPPRPDDNGDGFTSALRRPAVARLVLRRVAYPSAARNGG